MKSPIPHFLVLWLALLAIVAGLPGGAMAEPPSPSGAELKAQGWTGELPLVHTSVPASQTQLAPSSPTSVADWTRIAFQSYRDGNWEIYLAQGDGSQPARLTDHPASDTRPRLNRGATQVVFASDRDGNFEIYTMKVDRSGLVRLTFNDARDTSPSWSPDGGRILFTSQRDGNWELYTMNADGSAQVRLTQDRLDDVTPAWSPDGSHIAWVRRNGPYGVLMIMNADGSNPYPLTSSLRFLEHPAWSPDGTRLAFDYDADGDGWNELAVIGADGTGLWTMLDTYQQQVDVWMGSWSPDGKWMVFSRVEYVVQNNQLFIGKAYIERFPLGWPIERIVATGYDLLPDWQTADALPPTSAVKRLPPYSRSALYVTWDGSDLGGSGIKTYDVQYRDTTSTTWMDWLFGTTALSASFAGVPGHAYAFRSRATDNAQNIESWPAGNGDTATILYTWQLAGQVTDNRGIPLAHVPLSIIPTPVVSAQTDLYGRYLARLVAEGPHALAINQIGYADLSALTLNVHADTSLDLYLRPQDDIIRNGGFEADGSGLKDWLPGGLSTPTATTTTHHTGTAAAFLSLSCPYPCLSDPTPTWGGAYAYPDLVTDPSGNVHMIYAGGRTVYYTYRTSTGHWMDPLKLGENRDIQPGLAIDGRGTLHAMWNSDLGLVYSQKLSPGQWTLPAVIGPGWDFAIAADSRGGVHVIYRYVPPTGGCPQCNQIYYLEKLPSGTWKSPIPLDMGYGYMGPGITVGPDDTVHFIWQESWPGDSHNSGVYYRARLRDGTLTPREQLYAEFGYSFNRQRIAAAPDGGLHAFWSWAHSGYYVSRAPKGIWSSPVSLPKARGEADLAVDGRGVVHMVSNSSIIGDEATYYRRKVPEGEWSDPVLLHGDYHNAPSIAVDQYGLIHIVWEDFATIRYLTTRRSTQSGISFISQAITIPTDSHKPTLAFTYQLRGATPWGHSGLEVNISDSITTTQVFSITVSTPWYLASIDLQAWAGQTVTVTLALRQESGDPYVSLFLDDVSLGSWHTPVIQGVSPSRVEPWTAATITVTGQNFIYTPALRLNDKPLDRVQWVDEQTLQATLPATLSPGVYDVWVTNPGGQEGVLSGGLAIGKQVYLPVVFDNTIMR